MLAPWKKVKWKSLSCVQLFVIPYSPWNSLGQNTGVGSLFPLQGIFPTQVSRIAGRFWKAMTNLDSILKSRDITLPTKVCLVKAMVSPVVMYGYEGWTIKKADPRGINAFELWCWRRLLRVPWTARRSNQSILKEISPEYALEGPMLKLQYLGHLMQRTDSLEKTLCWERLKAGGEGDDRGWGGWMASPTGWIRVWASSGSWWWTGKPGLLQVHGVAKSWIWLSDWTALKEESLYWFNKSQQQRQQKFHSILKPNHGPYK